jgi:hypothetical protein
MTARKGRGPLGWHRRPSKQRTGEANRIPPLRLPQWARSRVKAALVWFGMHGWVTPAYALALLSRWRLTHE